MRYYESFHTKDTIFIVTELVKDGDLLNHVADHEYLEELEASRILKQLLNCLIYLHSSGIVHRDLKPDNILILKDPKTGEVDSLKLIDFGFAKIFQ